MPGLKSRSIWLAVLCTLLLVGVAALLLFGVETVREAGVASNMKFLWRLGVAVVSLGGLALALALGLALSLWRLTRALGRRDEHLDLALRSASAGLWQLDTGSGMVRWSTQMFALLGLPEPPAEVGQLRAGEDWRRFVHPDDVAMIEKSIADCVRERRPLRIEHRVRRPDGEVRWLSVLGRLGKGSATVMNGIAVDVTAQKLAGLRLMEAQTAAAEAGEAKSRFLAAASHDLRQPLQSMFLFAGLLDGYVTEGKPRRLLDELEAGMAVLGDLLDRLLNLSRLDAGKVIPTLEAFPIQRLIDDIEASMAPLAAKKGLEMMASPCSGQVRSDPTLLGQIMRNLVANAIKYTERGRIELTCHGTGGYLSISVCDSGIGIAPEQLARIWDEFHQVGGAARGADFGVGLGLAIVKRLTQLLGHTVSVTSELGRGSTFVVDVPLADETVCPPAEAPHASAEGRGRLALIVDDDKLVLDGLSALASAWGYKVVTAGSAGEALAAISGGRCPDLLLCDYRLDAERTGIDVISEIRQLCNHAIPSILITGVTEESVVRQVAGLGVGVLYKPISPSDLAKAVKAQAA